MTNPDLLIYALHAGFWAAFGVAIAIAKRSTVPAATAPAPEVQAPRTAPFSRAALTLHTLAFGVLYWGLGTAILPARVPHWFAGQQVAGALVIALGAGLACWAVASFHSWRLLAQLDAGHQLATGGPFRWLRHPIYMALNLFALGSALWVPAPVVWVAFLLMVAGGEWRARIEERVLADAFGSTYTDYCARTRRFIPGFY